MVYNKSKKGAQGIGTLIIFIAMILVAAVAAGVLISTVGKLQGKAENTGSEIQQRLGTGFSVFEVTTTDTSDGKINGTVDTFDISVQLSPGSDSVKISDVTLTLVTDSGTQSYSSVGANNFTISPIRGNVADGYIDRIDVVTFTFTSAYNITENEEFTVRLFPGTGSPLPVALLTPPAMTSTYTVLK